MCNLATLVLSLRHRLTSPPRSDKSSWALYFDLQTSDRQMELRPPEDSSVFSRQWMIRISRQAVLASQSCSNCECNSVWCSLRYSRHFWSEVHCCVKYPDCRELKQSWCFLTRFMHFSADMDSNFLHRYKGCFPTPYDMQALSTLDE